MSGFLNKPNDPPKSIFSNPPAQNASNPLNSTPNPAATNPPNNIFGTAKPGTSLFGNTSTAPAPSSFFGNASSTPAGGNIFGNTGSTTGSTTTSSAQPAPGNGPFGSSVFGSVKANPTVSTTLAAAPTTPAGGSLFGAGPSAIPPITTAAGTAGTTPSSFGNVSKPAATPASGSLSGGGSAPSTTGATPTTIPTVPPLFGNTGTNSTTPASGSRFGAVTTKPADNTAPKPSTFGTTIGATPASTVPAQTTGLFGLPPKPTESTSTATQGSTPQPAANAPTTSTGTTGTAGTASGASLFGGGLFGKTSAAPATSTTPATGSTAGVPTATAPSLFGAKTEEKKDGSATAPTPSPSLFGAAKTLTVTPAAPSTNTAIGAKPATAATPGASVAVPPPSMLRGKTLEEIVNRWSSDLETHTREFNRFAAEVAVWDRALIENGNDLFALYSHIMAAERQQDTIDQSLAHIEQQQKDLAATLDSYESLSQELLGGQGGSLRTLDTGPADTERDKNYILATSLQIQLDDLSGLLTQMIDAVNALSVSTKPNGESNDDPVSQISQILSGHLESLQWIDGAARDVEGKIIDIEKRVKDSGYSFSGSINQGKSRGFGLGR